MDWVPTLSGGSVSNPIRFGAVGFQPNVGAKPAGASGTGFAQRLSGGGGLGAALASGAQSLGREVLKAAMSGLPPVVQNLATNAAEGVVGQLTGQDAEMMDLVDKTHLYIMMN